MGRRGGPGAAGHLPEPAGSSTVEEALGLKAITSIPPSQRRTHMARPAWLEPMELPVTPWHEPPTLVPPPRASSAHHRPGGNPWYCLRGIKPCCSFLCTFGVEGHAQPGTLGWSLVRLEVLPHEDIFHLVLDGQHCTTNCGGRIVREEPRAWRMELGSSSAREDKAEEPCTTNMGAGEPQHVTARR